MADKIVYSEAFKQQVIQDIERGRFPSIEAARRAYGIGGAGTIRKWIEKSGKTHLLGKVIIVQTPDETSELKKLRQRVRELEKAVADMYIDNRILEAHLVRACRLAGVEDIEAFKKNGGGKP